MLKYKQNVAMKVTSKQYYEDLEKPLLAMGYIWDSTFSVKKDLDGDYPYLSNNYGPGNGQLGGVHNGSNDFQRHYVIEDYNPELYLALAAMNEEKNWIVGEYLVAYGIVKGDEYYNKIFKVQKLEGCNVSIGFAGHKFEYFYRKATIQEILKHFGQKPMKEKKIIRYESKPEFEKALIAIEGRAKFSFLPNTGTYEKMIAHNVSSV